MGGGESAKRPTPTQLEREAVQRIWAYYLELIPSRRVFDAKRERIIRNALRLVGEEATKRALLGLSRSPWHKGDNPDRKIYLELRHALKGKGDESDDERIEKAISWAAIHAPKAARMDPDKVQRYLEDVRYTLSLTHRPERQRAVEAYRKLRAAGFKVTPLERAPWARLER